MSAPIRSKIESKTSSVAGESEKLPVQQDMFLSQDHYNDYFVLARLILFIIPTRFHRVPNSKCNRTTLFQYRIIFWSICNLMRTLPPFKKERIQA